MWPEMQLYSYFEPIEKVDPLRLIALPPPAPMRCFFKALEPYNSLSGREKRRRQHKFRADIKRFNRECAHWRKTKADQLRLREQIELVASGPITPAPRPAAPLTFASFGRDRNCVSRK